MSGPSGNQLGSFVFPQVLMGNQDCFPRNLTLILLMQSNIIVVKVQLLQFDHNNI